MSQYYNTVEGSQSWCHRVQKELFYHSDQLWSTVLIFPLMCHHHPGDKTDTIFKTWVDPGKGFIKHIFFFSTGLTHSHSDTHCKAPQGLNGVASLTMLNKQLNKTSQGYHADSLKDSDVLLIPIFIIISKDPLRTLSSELSSWTVTLPIASIAYCIQCHYWKSL